MRKLLLVAIFSVFCSAAFAGMGGNGGDCKIVDDAGNRAEIRLEGLQVFVRENKSVVKDLYLYRLDADMTLSANSNIGDKSITVTDSTGAVAGDALTLYEGVRIFQTIISSVVDNTISFTTPLAFAFTTAAVVHAGEWNANVNGSVTPVEFAIYPPPSAEYHIFTKTVNMQDATDMDSGTFGGLPSLSNGLFFTYGNGTKNSLGLIVNNGGFKEQGFSTQYDAKAPAGVYGVTHWKNIRYVNGSIITISGLSGDKFSAYVQDDLTGLTLMSITVSGNIFEE